MSIASRSYSGSVVGTGVVGVDLIQIVSGGGVINSYTYTLTELGGMRSLEASVECTGTTTELVVSVPRSTNFLANNHFLAGGCSVPTDNAIESAPNSKQLVVPIDAGPTNVKFSCMYPYA